MMDTLRPGLIGLRNRALLLLGFAGGFRRSELVALERAHLRFVSQGIEVFVERSKTDQEQRSHVKVIAYGSDPATCPVRALKHWLKLSGLAEGAVFRLINRHEQLGARALTWHAVAEIVKRVATDAGLPTIVRFRWLSELLFDVDGEVVDEARQELAQQLPILR
jgi:integrase